MLALLEIFYSDSSSGSIWHGTFKIQNTFPLLDKVKNIYEHAEDRGLAE